MDRYWLGPGGLGVMQRGADVYAWGPEGTEVPVDLEPPLRVDTASKAGVFRLVVAGGERVGVLRQDGRLDVLGTGSPPIAIAPGGNAVAARCGDGAASVCVWSDQSASPLVLSIADAAELAFDSTGAYLAVRSAPEGVGALNVAPVGGGTIVRCGSATAFHWAAAHSTLVWTRAVPEAGRTMLSTWTPSGGAASIPCGDKDGRTVTADVSPDGRFVACLTAEREAGRGRVWLGPAGGGHPLAVVADNATDFGFTPKGDALWVRLRCREGACELASAPVEGPRARELKRLAGVGRDLRFDPANSDRVLLWVHAGVWFYEMIGTTSTDGWNADEIAWSDIRILTAKGVVALRTGEQGGVFYRTEPPAR
jgi:hypothetical protein